MPLQLLKNTTKSFYWSICIILLGSGTGCKKDVQSVKTQGTTYMKVYYSERDNGCYYIGPSNDKGYLILSSSGYDSAENVGYISVSKVDEYGSFQWEKILPDTFGGLKIKELSDGNILLNSEALYDKVIKMDRAGNVIFRGSASRLMKVQFNSSAIEGDDGNYFFSSTDGATTGSPSTNLIHFFGTKGNFLNSVKIDDKYFNGKVTEFNLFRVQNSETFYAVGTVFTYPFAWEHNPRIFVSKSFILSNSVRSHKNIILDPENTMETNLSVGKYLYTKDNKLIICAKKVEGSPANDHLYAIDENLNILWQLPFKSLGMVINIASMVETPDGNYLLSGSVRGNFKLIDQPFACKVSPSGKIVWKKIFTINRFGTFGWGSQLSDGGFIFGGMTNGFGGGSGLRDVFMMKTNSDGEL